MTTNTERFEIELPADLAAYVHAKVGRDALVSESDVVGEAVRFMQRRELKLLGLREMVTASVARGGRNTGADLQRSLDATAAELSKAGY